MHAIIGEHGTPQPFIQTPGTVVESLHMEAEGLASAGRFGEEILEYGRTDPGPAIFRQQRDIDPQDLVRAVFDVEPADGALFYQDDLEIGVGELGLVGLMLSRELHLEEGFSLSFAPPQAGQLLPAGAGVDFVEKRFVLRTDGAQRDRNGRVGRVFFYSSSRRRRLKTAS